MEYWQCEQIRKNLPSLLVLTDCSTVFIAELKAKHLLANTEVEKINAKETKHEKANLLYEILQTRKEAYFQLIKALESTKQTGALKRLLQLSSDTVRSLHVELQGQVLKLGNVLNRHQVDDIVSRLKHISLEESLKIHECLTSNDTLNLVRDTIPKPHPLYVPRFLTRRLAIDPEIFKKDYPDRFVFKDVTHFKLRNFVTMQRIEPSTRELLAKNITARFILLDSDADWKRICEKVNNPVHLIKYEVTTQEFVLETTSGGSSVLNQYLKQQQQSDVHYVSENVFVEKMTKENVQRVCICDSPGMGKSLLLANIARNAKNKWTEQIVAFIQFQNMTLTEDSSKEARVTLLKLISTSIISTLLLSELDKSMKLKFALFFDGLDEVHENLNQVTQFLQNIRESMPNANIFVTSRPVVRDRLEKSVGVIAYDIVPFNEETQRTYLVNHWSNASALSDASKLNKFAEYCLRFKRSLKENDTGAPLMCWLIANVYSDKAAVYADVTRKVSVNLSELNLDDSRRHIYAKFLQRQLGETTCNFACMHKSSNIKSTCQMACLVKSFHVWQALQLIFPNFAQQIARDTADFTSLKDNEIFAPGILQNQQNNCKLTFLHRTFAEYLVAEYYAKAIFGLLDGAERNKCIRPEINQLAFTLFFLSGRDNYYCMPTNSIVEYFYLSEAGVASFLDSMIPEDCEKTTFYTGSISSLLNIFFALMETCIFENFRVLVNILITAATCNKLELLSFYSNNVAKREWMAHKNPLAKMLFTATKHCDVKMVDDLVKFYHHVLETDIAENKIYLSTAIKLAIDRDDYELVKYFPNRFPILLKEELIHWCVESTGGQNESKAEREGLAEIVEMLLDMDKSLLERKDTLGKTPLLLAAQRGCMKMVRLIISKGGNIFAVDAQKQTILHLAAETENGEFFHEVVCLLGDKKERSQINRFNSPAFPGKNEEKQTPENLLELFTWEGSIHTTLAVAFRSIKDLREETLDLYLACGKRVETCQAPAVDLNAFDKNGFTALHNALWWGQSLKLVKHLISRGAKCRLAARDGTTVVHICAYKELLEHLKYFKEQGCDFHLVDSSLNNALQYACKWWRVCSNKRQETVEFLIEAGLPRWDPVWAYRYPSIAPDKMSTLVMFSAFKY